jgi:arsenate reductase
MERPGFRAGAEPSRTRSKQIHSAGAVAVAGLTLPHKFTRGSILPVTIYGIKNCDTMKKARAWLDSHGVAYVFHDYKTEGIAKDKLKQWSDELGWETLLNRAGTTFRKLPDGDKEGLNERKALALMLAQPSMIKRPVLDLGGKLLVGFKPEIYTEKLTKQAASGGRRAKA